MSRAIPFARHARLALRNLARQRTRTAVTLGAIAIGVAALVLTGGFVADIFVKLGEALIHSQSGHLQVATRGYFAQGGRDPAQNLIAEPKAVRDEVARVPGVSDTLLRLQFSGLLNNGRSDLSILGEGIEPPKEARLGTSMEMVAGRMLDERDRFGIMVGSGVADALQLSIGDRVVVLVNTPQGALNTADLDLVGVFRTFSKEFDDRAVRTSLATARELVDTRGASVIVVALDRTEATDRIAGEVRRRLAAQSYEVRTWVALNDFYGKTVALYDRQFGVLQIIVLVMVVLSVANSVNMGAYERTGEFGTMLALGNRSGDVAGLIVTENVILGLAGAVAGITIGMGAALVISAIGIPMPPPPNSNVGFRATVMIVPWVVAQAFCVGLAATVSASLLPAWRLARMPIVDALRQNM